MARSVKHTALVGGDHILNVDECIFSAVLLKEFQSLLDEVAQVLSLALGVVDLVANIVVGLLEEVHHREDLPVVGHKSLTDSVRALNKCLQDLEGDGNDFGIAGVQSSLDWDNELRNNWEHFCSTFFEHVKDTLYGEETVGVLLFADAFEEDGQVVMVVKLGDIDLPRDAVLRSVLNRDGEVSAVIEASEFACCNCSALYGSSFWFLGERFVLGPIEAGCLSSETISFF